MVHLVHGPGLFKMVFVSVDTPSGYTKTSTSSRASSVTGDSSYVVAPCYCGLTFGLDNHSFPLVTCSQRGVFVCTFLYSLFTFMWYNVWFLFYYLCPCIVFFVSYTVLRCWLFATPRANKSMSVCRTSCVVFGTRGSDSKTRCRRRIDGGQHSSAKQSVRQQPARSFPPLSPWQTESQAGSSTRRCSAWT